MDEVIELWCNIPNFGPTIYRHELIDHDDYIDVLFYIGSKTPLHMDMMIVLYIRCKPIVYDIYVYICWLYWAWTLKHMIDEMFCVGNGPWSTWSMICFVLSERLWSTWVLTFVLSIKLWNTWKYNWKCWT